MITSADLTWLSHDQHLASQAYRTLKLLRQTFKFVNFILARKTLYLTLVQSQLLYCSQVWIPTLIKDIVLLVKRGQLSTFFADYDSNYKSRLIALDLLPLMAEFESNDIMLCVKSLSLQELTLIFVVLSVIILT